MPLSGPRLQASWIATALLVAACSPQPAAHPEAAAAAAPSADPVKPAVVTERVEDDSDDPAIWIHPDDPAQSLILGTDKAGGLYVFGLDGKIRQDLTRHDLARPNNVDIQQGAVLDGGSVDIAVVAERFTGRMRVYRLPEVEPIDGGGIDVFVGEAPERRAPMGVALYRRPSDGVTFAIVSRKYGPEEGYLWQYRLDGDGSGGVVGTAVRSFGTFSDEGEIEAVAVDDELGYVYYSDEGAGIRKYAADPEAADADRELAFFGTDGFAQDREGISIYRSGPGTGYILVSDQQANAFRVFPREGTAAGPHDHPLITSIPLSTTESDGSDVTNVALGDAFPHGLFVAMADDGTFQLYRWEDLAARIP